MECGVSMDQFDVPRASLISDIRKPSRLGILCSVTSFLFLASTITFIVLYVIKNENHAPATNQTTCSSAACVVSSSDILGYLDTTVKPCDDFYQFSCGGFVKNLHIKDDQTSLTSFGIGQDFVDYALQELLEDKKLLLSASKDPSSAVYKALSFYKSCMNESVIETIAAKPILDIIEQYGSWTITNQTWSNNDSWILERILARTLRDLGTSSFISLDISKNFFNTSQVDIMIGAGSSGLERLDKKKLSSSSDSQTQKIIHGYVKFMSTVFQLLGATPGADLNQDVQNILLLEATFVQKKNSLQELAATVGYKKVLKVMTLNELNNFTSFKFNWTVYFEEVFKGTNKTIKPNQKMVVALPNDLKEIIDFLSQESNSLPKSFREAENEYLQIATGLETAKPRWRICGAVTNANFEYATALLLANKHVSEDARKRAADLFSEIKQQFIDGLQEQTWMDSKTRNEARIKVNAMKQSIGYPTFIKDPAKLNMLYEKIRVGPDDLFQNNLNIFKATTLNKIDDLDKPPDPTRFPQPPVGVNAFYDPLSNGMTVLMGMLHEPFYGNDRLKALNYGSIGMIIGHEISHGFDVSGSQFDAKGNLRSWWTNKSLDNFKERSHCLAEQYNNTMVFGRKVDGVKTLSENIADNGGLKYAFRAYRKWRAINGDEDKLPSLAYNNDQLFFIGFAQTWCAKYREERIDLLLERDTHAMNPVRVRVPLSNFPEFSEAFGCKVPEKTCTVW